MAALASSKYAALAGMPVGIAPAVGVSCGRSWMGIEALLSSYTIPSFYIRELILRAIRIQQLFLADHARFKILSDSRILCIVHVCTQ